MSHESEDGLLDAYLDGALSDVERARVEARVARDPVLARELAVARDVRRRAHELLDTLQLPPGRAGDGDLARIRARARASAGHGGGGVRRGPRLAPLAWAAALVGVIGVGLVLGRDDGREAGLTATIATTATEKAVPAVDAVAPATRSTEAVPLATAATDTATTRATSARGANAARPAAAAPSSVAARAPVADAAPVLAVGTAKATADSAPVAVERSRVAEGVSRDLATGRRAPDEVAPARRAQAADAPREAAARVAAARGAEPPERVAPAAVPSAAVAPLAAAPPPPPTGATAAPRPPASLDDARAILGVAPWALDGAALVSVARLERAAFDGTITTRPLVMLRYRERTGDDVTLLQQRALATDAPTRGWAVRDGVRVRVLGDLTRAGVDSVLARLRR